MLTDIFADRYSKRPLWESYTEVEAKLLMQGYRIVAEQIMPYWSNGKENESAKPKWQAVHDKLSMELGLSELGQRYYSYPTTYMGKSHTTTGTFTLDAVCKTFMTTPFPGNGSPDRFIKEKLSFVELAFRQREEELVALETSRPALLAAALMQNQSKSGGLRVPGNRVDGLNAYHTALHRSFANSVTELNERFRRAGVPLNYHNGFIQVVTDEVIEGRIETPFWKLVSQPIWRNVDVDMKDAVDRRDSGERDAAFSAAKALESVIKIISEKNGWNTGNEKGAHNYIDNLASERSGRFIEDWERDALKAFFSTVRNRFGHGPGSAQLPALSPAQTDWAIETCMSWIKTLILRMSQ